MSMRLNKNYKKSIKKGFFITGTDTNVGKTLVAASISRTLISQGFSTVAIKPAASGCFIKDNKLYSHDALTLQKYSSNKTLSYSSINPFAFKEPIAPHVAAKKNNINLSVSQILSKSQEALTCNADYIIIEGAGGWFTPINDHETMADLAIAYGYPVILVVGIRLGCINHALLTYKCMDNSRIKIAGWIANVIDEEVVYLQENIEAIKLRLNVPLLGSIPYMDNVNPRRIAQILRLR